MRYIQQVEVVEMIELTEVITMFLKPLKELDISVLEMFQTKGFTPLQKFNES